MLGLSKEGLMGGTLVERRSIAWGMGSAEASAEGSDLGATEGLVGGLVRGSQRWLEVGVSMWAEGYDRLR